MAGLIWYGNLWYSKEVNRSVIFLTGLEPGHASRMIKRSLVVKRNIRLDISSLSSR